MEDLTPPREDDVELSGVSPLKIDRPKQGNKVRTVLVVEKLGKRNDGNNEAMDESWFYTPDPPVPIKQRQQQPLPQNHSAMQETRLKDSIDILQAPTLDDITVKQKCDELIDPFQISK